MRFKVRDAVKPLEPIEWPDGTDQLVKNLTWDAQEILADMEEGKLTVREAMPLLMPLLLPGKTWDEIRVALDVETMHKVVVYASGKYEAAMKAMEEAVGNGVAGATDPVSPPPTSAGTSSDESPVATAVPCGAS